MTLFEEALMQYDEARDALIRLGPWSARRPAAQDLYDRKRKMLITYVDELRQEIARCKAK